MLAGIERINNTLFSIIANAKGLRQSGILKLSSFGAHKERGLR
jgi:hypothetical protein